MEFLGKQCRLSTISYFQFPISNGQFRLNKDFCPRSSAARSKDASFGLLQNAKLHGKGLLIQLRY
jgi:hypothetical protein